MGMGSGEGGARRRLVGGVVLATAIVGRDAVAAPPVAPAPTEAAPMGTPSVGVRSAKEFLQKHPGALKSPFTSQPLAYADVVTGKGIDKDLLAPIVEVLVKDIEARRYDVAVLGKALDVLGVPQLDAIFGRTLREGFKGEGCSGKDAEGAQCGSGCGANGGEVCGTGCNGDAGHVCGEGCRGTEGGTCGGHCPQSTGKSCTAIKPVTPNDAVTNRFFEDLHVQDMAVRLLVENQRALLVDRVVKRLAIH